MKMIELTRPASSRARVAVLPTGGLMLVETIKEDKTSSIKLYSNGISLDVKEPYEQIRDAVNTELEMWHQ